MDLTHVGFIVRDALYMNEKVADAELRYSDSSEAQLRISICDDEGTEFRYLVNVEVY